MCTCTTPDASVTLYYIHNRALLAYNTSLHGKDKEAEQYHTTIPEYQAPDISYKKKSVDISKTSSKSTRKFTNISPKQENYRNVTVDDLLSLSFPLSEAVNLMETGKTFYMLSTQPVCKQLVNFPIPLTQDMDFYFNIVTVVNFLTSVINAIVLAVGYKKCKDLLSGILTVAMETVTTNKGTQALKLSDNEITTDNPVTKVNLSTSNAHSLSYSTLWIFLIALLSMLTIFALYWIFILIVRPLTRKSNTCRYRYILPCYRSHTDFLIPATDIFLDVVHVSSGEQIRVFLMTIAAPACSLSFTGSVKFSNFQLTKKNLLTTLYIDWHNCLLHYNEHVITLPSKGTTSFQPNLLTSFSRPGLYNLQLLARHMDALLQIPHALELDFVTASDLLSFPYRHPVNP